MANASQTNTGHTTWLRDWTEFSSHDGHTLTHEELLDHFYWTHSREDVFMIYKCRDRGFRVTVDQSRYHTHPHAVAIFKFRSAMQMRQRLSKMYDFIYNHIMTEAEATSLCNYMLETYHTNLEVFNRSMFTFTTLSIGHQCATNGFVTKCCVEIGAQLTTIRHLPCVIIAISLTNTLSQFCFTKIT